MAANPSALLLLTCVNCTDAVNSPIPDISSTCSETQNQSQSSSTVSVTEPIRCISSPEMVSVALNPARRAATVSTAADSQNAKSQNASQARDRAPHPAPPETFNLVLASSRTGQSNGQSNRQSNRQSNGQSNRQTSSLPTPPSVLDLGSRGEAVRQLQEQLRQLGYYTGAIDGIYGTKTETAVAKFQQTEGLGVDGIVGPSTWRKLQARSEQPPVGNETPEPETQKPETQKPETPELEDQEGSEDPDSTAPSPPAALATPNEEAESPSTPMTTPEPRDQREAAPKRYSREPVENEDLYFWLLVWAIVYGGGNLFIFWNRAITNLWLKLLEGITQQRRHETLIPKPVGAPSGETAPAFVSTQNKPVHKPGKPATTSAIKPPQAPYSKQAAHHTQVPSSSIEKPHPKVVQRHGDRVPSSPQKQPSEPPTEQLSSTETVLVAAPANGGFVEPIKNLLVDLSGPSTRSTPKSHASTSQANKGTLIFPTPASKQKNFFQHQKTAQKQPEPANPAKLSHEQANSSSYPDVIIATLPLSDPTGTPYTYMLLNDAAGRFKIKGNELRIIDEALNQAEDKSRHTITVRRTDASGSYVDKSFILNLNKTEAEKPKSTSNSSPRSPQSSSITQPG